MDWTSKGETLERSQDFRRGNIASEDYMESSCNFDSSEGSEDGDKIVQGGIHMDAEMETTDGSFLAKAATQDFKKDAVLHYIRSPVKDSARIRKNNAGSYGSALNFENPEKGNGPGSDMATLMDSQASHPITAEMQKQTSGCGATGVFRPDHVKPYGTTSDLAFQFAAGVRVPPPNPTGFQQPMECTRNVCENANSPQLSTSLQYIVGLQRPATTDYRNGDINGSRGDQPSVFPQPSSTLPTSTQAQYSCLDSKAKQTTMGTRPNAWSRPTHIPIAVNDLPRDFIDKDGAINLDLDRAKQNVTKLEKALVGKLLGRHLPFSVLKLELSKKWAQFGLFKLTSVSNDCFICIFETSEARDAVLMGGPWFVAGHVIGLDCWKQSFSPDSLHGFTVPI